MANIPTIPGSARVQDVQIGAKRNVGPQLQALGQVSKVAGAADSAIQQGLSVVADYEERKRKAEEVYVTNMASLSFQKLQTDYQHQAETMPDEEIVKNWNETASAWKQDTINQYAPKLSPRAKQALTIFADKGIGSATAGFQEMADLRAHKRRESAAVSNAMEFLKSGNPDKMAQADKALTLAVNAQDMTPEKADYYRSQFPSVLQQNQIRNGIEKNAAKTVHDIDDGKFDKVPENTLLSLRRQAEAQWNKNKVAKYQDIRKQQSEGKVFTRDELNKMADADDISGSSIDPILKAQKGDVPDDEVQANISKVHDMILDIPHGASADDRLMATAKIHASKEYQSLPNEVKKDFDESLKEGKTTLPDLHRKQAEMMKRTFEDVSELAPTLNRNIHASPFVSGGLKKIETMSDADFKAAYGHHVKRQDVMKREAAREEQARDWYADAQQQYISWARSPLGQKATPAQAEEERVRLGFGTYSSVLDVVRDFQAGKIDSATCKKIGLIRFGVE